MKKIFLLFSTLFIWNFSTAQTLADAVRFSTFDVNSTARSVGVGGGLSALGADFSTLSVNPAGLSMYRSSEFTFTPSLVFNNSEATLRDGDAGTQSENKTNFNFSNIGLVIARRPESVNWKTANFGIGLNRVANFHQRINYSGVTRGTIVDRWLELADGNFPENLDNFEAGLAFDVGGIFLFDNFDDVYDADLFPDDFVLKSQEITRRGSINELVFSFAGNYKEKLMIGGSIGVPFLRFEENRTYRESDPNNEFPEFSSLRFSENLETRGNGINVKFGTIIRLHQTVRVGLAIHTPTLYRLEDNFTTTVAYDFDPESVNVSVAPADSPDLNFEYIYRTPWRFIGSAGFVIGKIGFLSGEIEFVNFSGGQFRSDDQVENPVDEAIFNDVNSQIDNQLESNLNFRFGGEIAVKKFRFRGGLNLSGTPYNDDSNLDSSLSLGVGVRFEKIFLDLAYRRIMNNEIFTPYIINDTEANGIEVTEQEVNIDDNRNKLLLTFGARF